MWKSLASSLKNWFSKPSLNTLSYEATYTKKNYIYNVKTNKNVFSSYIFKDIFGLIKQMLAVAHQSINH